MKSLDRLRNRFEEWRDDPDYVYETLVLDITEQVVGAMIRADVRRADLAERLGTSRAYVTKLLDGQENMTLKTIVRVAQALDLKVDVKLAPPAVARRKKRQVKSGVDRPVQRAAPTSTASRRNRVVAARSR